MFEARKISFHRGDLANLFIVYELDKSSRDLNTDFTLGDCLFRAVKLTKNADLDKYGYSGLVLDLMDGHFFHCQMVNGVWCRK